ncbi:MAG: nucleotidyl transferase AbiEii/AbiGii toxin family protein [Bacteroidales bacterium]
MILQKEIASQSELQKIPKSTIDKDWALGHFLAAIYSETELKEVLVFKGGTCLKKCWFPDYRFSEDLDFTSRSASFQLTRKHLESVCLHLKNNIGLLTHISSLVPLKSKDKLTGYEAIIRFWGADHSQKENPPAPERWLTSIKIEIILYENLIFPPILKPINHTYSDQIFLDPNLVPCYSIEEVLSEKIRALIQRSYTAPRDFFDIWYLMRNNPDLDYSLLADGFHRKMEFKGLTFSGIEQLINPRNDKSLKDAWKNSLAHQLPPQLQTDYEPVRNELLIIFKKMFANE